MGCILLVIFGLIEFKHIAYRVVFQPIVNIYKRALHY
jgi:hypothetical protein